MKTKEKLKKVGTFILNIFEIYLPFATFVVLFIVFLTAIFFRYFLTPLKWTLEVSLVCFIWVVLLGAVYAWKTDAHVSFKIIYDKLNVTWQRIFTITSNSLIFIACFFSIKPALNYLTYMHDETTAAFGIRFDIIFFPIVIFFVLISGHALIDTVKMIKKLIRKEP